jgi:ubiquinone/menaquinone biosynthesis C-methylase UbiE
VTRVFARTVLEHADLNPGARVLDVCAGTGSLALQAAKNGLQVTAIDSAPVTTAHLAEQLLPYPGCTAEVMDALQMHWNKGQFDAAFSVLGVMFLGPQVPTVLAEMRRAVRPGGVVAVVNWATPRGAPHFDILAQASRDLDDPDIGTLEALLPGDLSREGLQKALSTAGLVDVHTETLHVVGQIPTSESFLTELEPFFAMVAGFGDLTVGQRERLNTAIVDAIRPIEEGNAPRPGFHANLALGHVPGED